MNHIRKNIFVWIMVGFFGFSTLGCGYILYPERRQGRAQGGQIDPVVLVMDLLWLIPGIVPGVIALVWDGIHGSWYLSGSTTPMLSHNPQKVPHMTALRPIEIRSTTPPTIHLRDVLGRMYTLPTTHISLGRTTATLPAHAAKGPASLLVSHNKKIYTLPVIID